MLALKHFPPNLLGRHVLVRSDHTSVQPVSSSVTEAVDLGLSLVGKHQSNAHTRGEQYGGRFSLTSQASRGGQETQPRGGGDDMAAVWQGRSGLFLHQQHQPSARSGFLCQRSPAH